jgi:hypothetical protein
MEVKDYAQRSLFRFQYFLLFFHPVTEIYLIQILPIVHLLCITRVLDLIQWRGQLLTLLRLDPSDPDIFVPKENSALLRVVSSRSIIEERCKLIRLLAGLSCHSLRSIFRQFGPTSSHRIFSVVHQPHFVRPYFLLCPEYHSLLAVSVLSIFGSLLSASENCSALPHGSPKFSRLKNPNYTHKQSHSKFLIAKRRVYKKYPIRTLAGLVPWN